MPKRISYRQLANILIQAGFDERKTKGAHLVFIHQETGARIVLPPPRQRSVPDVYVRAIGKMVDEYGIMTREEFSEFVFEKEL